MTAQPPKSRRDRRQICCVPFCPESRSERSDRFGGEWLCQDHRKLVPATWRSAFTRSQNRIEALCLAEGVVERVPSRGECGHRVFGLWRIFPDGGDAYLKQAAISRGLWRRIKARAIERAAGIT